MPTKLKNLRIDRVDLVDKGANPDAHILLFKRKGDEGVMKFEDVLKSLTPEQQAIIKSELEKVGPGGEMTPEEKKKKEAEMAAMNAALATAKADLAKSTDQIADLTTQLAKATKSNEPGDSDIFKGLNPEVKKYLEDIKKEADASKAIVKALEEEKLTKQYTDVAKSLTHLAVQADEFGLVLKSFAQHDTVNYGKLEAMLKSFNEAVAKGNLFKEIGQSGSTGAVDPLAKLEAKAQELVTKNATTMTKEQAMAHVMRSEPELYSEYVKSIKGGE
jgi:membrane-associated HD superfamily phosphohydrolase